MGKMLLDWYFQTPNVERKIISVIFEGVRVISDYNEYIGEDYDDYIIKNILENDIEIIVEISN